MRDIRAIRRNEQRKAFANQFYNLGAALSAGSAIRIVDERAFDWVVLLWIVSAFALIVTGYGFLGLIEDDADEL